MELDTDAENSYYVYCSWNQHSNLANQIKYEFPGKFIVVVYVNKDIANISIRGNNAREITLKAIKDIEGAVGGGHDKATGAKINIDSLPDFKKKVEELVE